MISILPPVVYIHITARHRMPPSGYDIDYRNSLDKDGLLERRSLFYYRIFLIPLRRLLYRSSVDVRCVLVCLCACLFVCCSLLKFSSKGFANSFSIWSRMTTSKTSKTSKTRLTRGQPMEHLPDNWTSHVAPSGESYRYDVIS